MSKNNMMRIQFFTFLFLLFQTYTAIGMPNVQVLHQRNNNGFAQVQVQNSTLENLICYVSIDGHKTLFRLKPAGYSKWYTATDTRFNHAHFSVWCDYLRLHPKYQKK